MWAALLNRRRHRHQLPEIKRTPSQLVGRNALAAAMRRSHIARAENDDVIRNLRKKICLRSKRNGDGRFSRDSLKRLNKIAIGSRLKTRLVTKRPHLKAKVRIDRLYFCERIVQFG